jgi:AraC family transcriptional regulator
MKHSPPPSSPQILFSSVGRGWNAIDAALVQIPRGVSHVRGSALHTLGIHFGPAVNADCFCDGVRLRHVQKPGDIGFVPAGMDSSWEDDAECQILRVTLQPSLLSQVADDLGRSAAKIDLIPKLELRDRRIEAIGWASLKPRHRPTHFTPIIWPAR